jgi:dimethylglycine dehydrogenase
LDSLRLEKSYGIWNSEFTQGYTAEMSYLKNFIAYEKKDGSTGSPQAFIGKEAVLKERETRTTQTLVTLQVDAVDAEPSPYSPVKQGDKVVGFVTSSAYGHYVKQSLAMAYIDDDAIHSDLTVDVIGQARKAIILTEPAYDPIGEKLRA